VKHKKEKQSFVISSIYGLPSSCYGPPFTAFTAARPDWDRRSSVAALIIPELRRALFWQASKFAVPGKDSSPLTQNENYREDDLPACHPEMNHRRMPEDLP